MFTVKNFKIVYAKYVYYPTKNQNQTVFKHIRNSEKIAKHETKEYYA